MVSEIRAGNEPAASVVGTSPGSLRTGTVGWVLLASLGVSYVIAGDYAGWNYGLAHGGWGGLLGAVTFGLVMYGALIVSLAELASSIPDAGGGAAFVARAFSTSAACLAGAAILIEYVAAAACIAVFLQAYLRSLIGLGGSWVVIGAFAILALVHSTGVGEAMRALLIVAVFALGGLIAFLSGVASHFDSTHLVDLPISRSWGANKWLPGGWIGLWSALPFGTAFFLGVEGIAMAAEEAREPQRNVPRGMLVAMLVLSSIAFLIVFLGPGSAGARRLQDVENPLIVAIDALSPGGYGHWLRLTVNICGLAGLFACLFSAMFAYSRLAFSLARAGLISPLLARTNRRGVPVYAIGILGAIACSLALSGAAEQLYVVMVCAGTTSYLFILSAHWALRQKAPELARPYRTPGGRWTSGFAFLTSVIALGACFAASPVWSSAAIVAMLIFLGVHVFQQ